MNTWFDTLGRWLVRALLLAVGLVVFLSLLAVAALFALVWGARLAWARITGRPLTPWASFRIDPRQGFAWAQAATRRADAQEAQTEETSPVMRAARLPGADLGVTDVQPRNPQPDRS